VAAGASIPVAPGTDGPISLGSATLEQLDSIDGIGPVTAQSILDFRDEHGGLSSVDELDEVSGIGPTTMEALRGRLQP
jgi:competence protein ComEA